MLTEAKMFGKALAGLALLVIVSAFGVVFFWPQWTDVSLPRPVPTSIENYVMRSMLVIRPRPSVSLSGWISIVLVSRSKICLKHGRG